MSIHIKKTAEERRKREEQRPVATTSDQRWNQCNNYYRKEWMTDDQWKASQLLADAFGGFHNMKPIKECGLGVRVILRHRDLSTYDFNQLTALVILAHARCVRVSICIAGFYLEARAYARKPDGTSQYERHPTLAQLRDSVTEAIGKLDQVAP